MLKTILAALAVMLPLTAIEVSLSRSADTANGVGLTIRIDVMPHDELGLPLE